jgi:hypothetical protein
MSNSIASDTTDKVNSQLPDALGTEDRNTGGLEHEKEDNEPLFGDRMDRNSEASRFIFQNVNSLGSGLERSKLPEILHNMEACNATVVGLAECCINWNHRFAKQEVTQMIKKVFGHCKTSFSSSNQGLGRRYQPGGTMMMINNPMSSRVTRNTQD